MLYPVELRARLEFSFDFEQIARRHDSTEAKVAGTVRLCASFIFAASEASLRQADESSFTFEVAAERDTFSRKPLD